MSTIGSISYGLAGLGFAFLTALLLVNWRGGSQALLLTMASAGAVIWAGMLCWLALGGSVSLVAIQATETGRVWLWLLFLVCLLLPLAKGNRWLYGLMLPAVVVPPLIIALLVVTAWQVSGVSEPPVTGLSGYFVYGALGFSLLGLVLTEQLYRNVPEGRRWAMKYLCIALALMFVYDMYLYSQTLLFRHVDTVAWHARGAVHLLAVPLLLLAVRRNESWAMPVFVSRYVAFHSAAIVMAGGYLLFLAGGGYFIRDFGGTWGQFAQIVLMAGGAVLLVSVVSSSQIRARLNVFVTKHFFRNKYDYREEWLRLTHRLADEAGDQDPYQRCIRAVADIVGSPGGAIWRVDDAGEFRLAGSHMVDVTDAETIGPEAPLVTFLREQRWIIDLDEWRQNKARYGDMFLPQGLDSLHSAWAIVPLLQQERLSGFLLLTRPPHNAEITWEDRDLLKTIGRQVANYLGQFEDAQALSQARQFEAFNQLTAFLMHDLKNVIAQQSLVVRNAEKHKHNPEFVDDAMATVSHSVKRMERLLEHLQKRQRHERIIEHINVPRLLEQIVSRCSDRKPEPQLEAAPAEMRLAADPEEFLMVMMHIVRNAQDATPEDGVVKIDYSENDDGLVVDVTDNGSGMSADFIRDALFRPFHTTKSAKGMGIGAHQAREFVQRLGGRVTVTSSPGQGTSFHMTFPGRFLSEPTTVTPLADNNVVTSQ